MPTTIESFTTLADSVVATTVPISHSFVDVGQWMTVQFNMGGFGSRTAPPVGAGWRALADNIGFGSRRVSIYGKIKEAGDGSSSTFTFDIALSSRVTIGWGDGAAPVADWVAGLGGVRSTDNVVSGKTVLAGDSTHTVSKSIDAIPDSLVIASQNEATSAAETTPPYYVDFTAGWTFVHQSNQTEWPIILKKEPTTSAATGDCSVTYPNPQATGNGMGVQYMIPAVGSVPANEGTFGTSVTVGPGTFTGEQPPYVPTELEVVGTPTSIGITAPYSAPNWVLQRPAIARDGDVLVAELRSQNSVGPLPEVPVGWFLETDVPLGGYTGPRTHGMAWHRIVDIDAEPASYTFLHSQTLRRIGVMFTLRASAGKIIVADSHTPLYLPSGAGADVYTAAGWDVQDVPGLLIASFTAEFSAPTPATWDSTPAGFSAIATATTDSDPATTSRTQIWIGQRKLTAEPMAPMVMDYSGAAIGVGFDAVLFREITPEEGEGSFAGEIKVGVGGYFGGYQPPKPDSGFSSVTEFLNTPGATSAHRGGSLTSPEMSDRAYRRAASRGYGVLEFSAQRTLDGVWIGCHDPDLNRTSQTAGLPPIASMTWAEVQRYSNSLNAEGAPVPYLRLDEFLATWTPTHVCMIDPKNALAFVSEFNAIAANYGGPEKIIMKYAGAGTGQGGVARNWRDALGYQTWGYFYEPDIADGYLETYQGNWTILGMEYQADTPAWAAVTSYGKPVMAHIVPTQTAYNEGMSKGARFVQVSGTTVVAPVGAESTPIPGGSFGSPVTVGPGYFTGVAPTEEPGVIGFGRVRGLFVAGIADGVDVGAAPDIRPMSGNVTFRASVPRVRVPTGDPVPLTLFLQSITVPLDAEGYLTGVNGHDISLLATDDPAGTPVGWKWTATFALQFDGKDVSAQPIEFSLPVDGLVDLSVVGP